MERNDHPAPQHGALPLAVEITESIGSLPAVATIDWCDRAAACLTRLGRSGVGLIVIGTIDETGRLLSTEAIGVATGGSVDRARGGVAKAQPKHGMDSAAEERVVDGLRSRAERLSHIGFTPPADTGSGVLVPHPVAAMLGSLPTGRNWRTGPVGRVWAEVGAGDLLVGVAQLGDVEAGRVLVVQMMAQGWSDSDPALVLRALMPVLARRAVMAIGPLRSSESQWLTAREQIVLDQLALGKSVKQIAEEIGRSPHTVHDHVKSLHRKLNATSRGELIARALGHLQICTGIRGQRKNAAPGPGETEGEPVARAANGTAHAMLSRMGERVTRTA